MHRTHRRPGLVVTTGGKGIVAHAGARLLCDLADRLGLSGGLSEALAPTKRRRSGHDGAEFNINQVWLALVLVAGDLLAWMKGLCLEGELAKAEPKRLRFALLHAAGVIVRSARRMILRIAAGWPWADEFVAAFARLPSPSLIT